MPCPAKSVTTEKACALGGLLHGAGDVAYPVADLRLLDSRVERRARDAQQTFRAIRNFTHRHGARRVAVKALVDHAEVQTHDVARLKPPP